MLELTSFLRPNNIPDIDRPHLLIHSFIYVHLGCFQFLPIVNSAAVNMSIKIYLLEILLSILSGIYSEAELLDIW